MEAASKSHMWWLGLDREIEAMAKSCKFCLAGKGSLHGAAIYPWIWPNHGKRSMWILLVILGSNVLDSGRCPFHMARGTLDVQTTASETIDL